jgi:hypothetical protein
LTVHPDRRFFYTPFPKSSGKARGSAEIFINIKAIFVPTLELLYFYTIMILEPVQKTIYNSEFGYPCGVKRRKAGFSLQSFGCTKRIPSTIPCMPRVFPDIEQSSLLVIAIPLFFLLKKTCQWKHSVL